VLEACVAGAHEVVTPECEDSCFGFAGSVSTSGSDSAWNEPSGSSSAVASAALADVRGGPDVDEGVSPVVVGGSTGAVGGANYA
jgi:hypothetical protein